MQSKLVNHKKKYQMNIKGKLRKFSFFLLTHSCSSQAWLHDSNERKSDVSVFLLFLDKGEKKEIFFPFPETYDKV